MLKLELSNISPSIILYVYQGTFMTHSNGYNTLFFIVVYNVTIGN